MSQHTYTYEYPRPAMTSDCVIFGFDGNAMRILLIERGVEPYKGYWALPGGFMRMNETIEQCAARELQEETGVRDVFLEQFHTFSSVDRDPRGRVVTVAFIALVRPDDYEVAGGDDATMAIWFDASMLPPLAFDHQDIVAKAKEYLREALKTRPIAFQLLNEAFSLDELRKVYEVINGTTYDRRNFQRKALQSDLLMPTAEDAEYTIQEEPRELRSTSVEYCCAEPSPMIEEEDTRSRNRYQKPRRGTRLFSLNRKKNRDTNSEDEKGSLRDLFNF